MSLFVIPAGPEALALAPRATVSPQKVLAYEMLDDDGFSSLADGVTSTTNPTRPSATPAGRNSGRS